MNDLEVGKYYEVGNETLKIVKFLEYIPCSTFSTKTYLVDYIKLSTKEKLFQTSLKYTTLSFINYKETSEEIFNRRLDVINKSNKLKELLVL